MSLVIISPAKNLVHWQTAINKIAPSIEVFIHDQEFDTNSIEFALAWSHPKGIFSKYPNLKCICSMGAGVDHLLSDTDIPDHIKIIRIIDPNLSQDMFEFVLASIMNRLRSLTIYRLNQQSSYWKKKPYINISDIRVGIMGTGVIGNHTATKLQSVGFSVHGWGRTAAKQPTPYTRFWGEEQLPAFLGQSDILVCLLPLTPSTEGILNRKNLRMLPHGAWLINLGRGGHIVEDHLIEVLNSGHLEGANLDVFQQEPLPEGHPFWQHPLINITPHIASITSPDSVAPQIADNYFRMRENKQLLNIVDPKKGY